jgi:hypothetical protein
MVVEGSGNRGWSWGGDPWVVGKAGEGGKGVCPSGARLGEGGSPPWRLNAREPLLKAPGEMSEASRV